MSATAEPRHIAVIGAGPAGLMAAETLAQRYGRAAIVTVYDRKTTPARKFLMAGRGGLNLTHSEDSVPFMGRYGEAAPWLHSIIEGFTPADLRQWCEGLGEETFVGSSGRIFPRSMKASPLLRAWRARLDGLGVRLQLQHDWTGWAADGALSFATPAGPVTVQADASVLALGGASWAKLGSDGSWAATLADKGIEVAPFQPANMGFTVGWSDYFRAKFAGHALKPLALRFADQAVVGEAMISVSGIEGGAVYALSRPLRDALLAGGEVIVNLDLNPALSVENLTRRLQQPRQARSLSNVLRREAGLSPLAIALLREAADGADPAGMSAVELATRIKSVPLRLTGIAPLDRAISTAGGIKRTELDDHLMLRRLPGTFVAGEMLDWEAPTGGYLLQACFATGVAAAQGVITWLDAS